MSEQKVRVEASGGVGFLGLLTILFIGLKLGNVIDWSWLWVLSPLWIPFAVVFAIAAIIFLAMCLLSIPGWYRGWRLRRTVKKHLKIYKP
jgi:hypothetical protein